MKTSSQQLSPTRLKFECQLNAEDRFVLKKEALQRFPEWGKISDLARQKQLLQQFAMERSLQRFLAKQPQDLRLPPSFQITRQSLSELSFESELELYPQVQLPATEAVSIEVQAPEKPSPAEIQAALEALQLNFAQFEQAQRPAAWGDQVMVDLYASFQGQILPQSVQNERVLLLRKSEQASASEAAWLEGLIGMQPGERKEIAYTLPADHPNPEWRGQPALSHVKMLVVAKVSVAALNDHFAKALGFETLEALLADLARQLSARKESQWQQRVKELALAAYVDQAQVEIAPEWLEQELEQGFAQSDAPRLQAQGLDSQQLEKLRQSWLKQPYLAEIKRAQLKSLLVLREVIRQANLRVEDSELDEALAELGKSVGKDAVQMREQMAQEQKLLLLVERILIEKASVYLFQAVTVTHQGQVLIAAKR